MMSCRRRFQNFLQLKKIYFHLLLVLVTLFAGQSSSFASPSPVDTIQEAALQIQKLLKTEEMQNDIYALTQKTEEIFQDVFDFSLTSALVLNQTWKSASADQRTRFIEEFKTLFLRNQIMTIKDFPYEVVKVSELLNGKTPEKTVVHAEFQQKNGIFKSIDYRMAKRPDGSWKAYDTLIDNMSWVQNYRASFSSELAQSGSLDQVIVALKTRNQQAFKNSPSYDNPKEEPGQEFGFSFHFVNMGEGNWPEIKGEGGPCATAAIGMYHISVSVDSLLASIDDPQRKSRFLTNPIFEVQSDTSYEGHPVGISWSNVAEKSAPETLAYYRNQISSPGGQERYDRIRCVYSNAKHYAQAIYSFFSANWKSCPQECGLGPKYKSFTTIPKF